MYTKYKTIGIIVGGSNVGEASRLYNIFTEDFGLIRVRAQGIREIKSKLRYNLQNLFLTKLTLVRGKSGWRIIEVKKLKSFPESLRTKAKLQSGIRILLFLKRMLAEEEANKELFAIIEKGLGYMESTSLSHTDIRILESLIILRVLKELGYAKDNPKFKAFLENSFYNKEILEYAKNLQALILKEVNYSIQASQL